MDTDENGDVVQLLDYYPFGGIRLNERSGNIDNKRKAFGHEYDDGTDLYYMRARYQNPAIGRFISQDPVYLNIGNRDEIEQKTGKSYEVFLADPQNLNSYSYARNNPLKHVDVTGEYWESAIDVISLGLSLYDFNKQHSFVNGLFVGLDAAGLALPVPAVFGYIKNGARAVKIASYFNKIANNAGDVARLGKLFVQNAGFKFTGRAWSIGEAGNDVASLVGHYVKHGVEVGAKNVSDYYNKANNFIDSKNYTHSWAEGSDMVYYNAENNFISITNGSGQISSYYKVTDQKKLDNISSIINKSN
ncbi:MAG: RHS repeat-associated core domain-containing protein [Patescibacteria group bacterium]